MPNYEAVYYFFPNLEEGTVETLNTKFSSQITDLGGQVTKINAQGKRRLAYPIKGQEEGYFIILEFQGDSKIAKELGRIMRISDEVLRSIIVRVN